MNKYKNSGKSGYLRKVLYIAGSIASICLLLYGAMWILSLIGRQSITVDGLERKYRVHLPADYNQSQRYPLVIALHMYSGTARTMEWISQLNPVADKYGFIVVYPEGYKLSWAEGSNEFAADRENIDDTAFIAALISNLNKNYAVDLEHVYITGFSSGGLMAQRLGCELSGQIRGIATVGATLSNKMLNQCQPDSPVSVLMINGTDDQGVPYNGNTLYASVEETVNIWTQHNQCMDPVESTALADQFDDGTSVIKTGYPNCSNAQVILYTIQGGGHTWPGGSHAAQLWGLNGKISRELNAGETILTFFADIQ